MNAFLILEDGTVFKGTSIGSTREIISEIVFNTSMWGYLEVLTDPSYAGQAVCMTYPLIGNYGICHEDMESLRPWPDGYIVNELSRMPSNFRSDDTIQNFLEEHDIPGIAGIDTRALTKILREKGTMNGMITTNENYNLDEILPKIKEYRVTGVVKKVSCTEKKELKGDGFKVALLDIGAKNNIGKSLNERGCDVIHVTHRQKKLLRQTLTELCYLMVPGIQKSVNIRLNRLENYTIQIFQFLQSALDISLWHLLQEQIQRR